MIIRFKIRLLLLLLTLVFALTAVTIHYTFDKKDILISEAKVLERNLRKKERFINQFLNSPVNFQALKTVDKNEEWGRTFIPEFEEGRKIFLQTFLNHKVSFWNSIEVYYPDDKPIREGSSFIAYNNGWYQAIKKSRGNFSVICYIPVKANYPYTNNYLNNIFSKDLIKDNNLDIASINDKNVYNIRNTDGQYLFSVKLKSGLGNSLTSHIEFWMWFLSIFLLFILINHTCIWIAEKGYIKSAIILLTAIISLVGYFGFGHLQFYENYTLKIYDPKYYSTTYFPSIGVFLMYTIFLVWIGAFIFKYRNEIRFSKKLINKNTGAFMFFILSFLVIVVGYQLDRIFSELILNSTINLDVTNVLNLNWLSWLVLLLYCLSALFFFLITETALIISLHFNITNRTRLIIYSLWLIIAVINRIIYLEFTILFLLVAGLIFLQAWRIFKSAGSYTAGYFIGIAFGFALIASYKLSHFQNVKEKEDRKELAVKLENADDPNTVLLFLNVEKQILKDSLIADYFISEKTKNVLTRRLQQQYFDGYLSRYTFNIHAFSHSDDAQKDSGNISLNAYKNLVLAGSIKVSDYFYRISNTFGYQSYFALLPVKKGNNSLGTLVLELKSQQISDEPSASSSILNEGKINENKDLRRYSYAFYKNGRLLNQYGKYVYDLANYDFAGKVKKFVFVRTENINSALYNHLIYRPNEFNLIVVSKPVNNFTTRLSAISFIFIILMLFACFILFLREVWKNFKLHSYRLNKYKIKYFVNMDRVLYKTRIQASMVGAVVFTLLITGIITFYNISRQYRLQQNEDILEKVSRISDGFDKQLFRKSFVDFSDQTASYFNSLAEVNAADLNLYNMQGDLIYTTQPKLYAGKIVAAKMDAMAFLHLNKLQKSEHINNEHLGDLNFITAYTSIKNNRNEPVAYLGLPYHSNEQDFQQNIGVFLNALINIYTLVFVAIGFLAVFVANQITSPLSLIQKILSETNIGRKNKPIVWDRDDEIGNLIKEYNNMILALEKSAGQLAHSERESAWREMAKQIAHEIKNPLTPLKLGVQLLEKSWREKDIKFDIKFEKFSKSFIEQIDSLSHIASEFSNFAKMPDTILTQVNLKNVIERSVEVYSQMDNINITLIDHTDGEILIMGDKDQLLRSFNNLIKNSVEAIPEGREGLISITLESKNEMADIVIQDNGNGIPEHLEPRIFTPNFSTKSSGTGLGLAFVKQALENMNGTIRYETEMQKGTIFYLAIPLLTTPSE
ncbi:MAG TPA: ATP-binding protein [Sphingobacteriaceae bacterium]|nr:ATP-binding protein [Sphingobacteriaceae bacterium]